MRHAGTILLAVLMLASRVAGAADLPVSYTVAEKPLKAAVAGTSLTFELYGDAACATLVQSTPVLAENVGILSKLKQMTPKNDVKLPNTVELRTTLAGVTAGGNLYLKVVGTGVTPVGGACQAQAAVIARSVRDANGAFVASFPDYRRTIGGDVVSLQLDSGGIFPTDPLQLYFTSSDCSGSPLLFMSPGLVKPSYRQPQTSTLYIPPTTAPYVSLGSYVEYSFLIMNPGDCFGGTFVTMGECCHTFAGGGNYGPATTFDTSVFALPLHVEGQP
jgi:hypothetical protein